MNAIEALCIGHTIACTIGRHRLHRITGNRESNRPSVGATDRSLSLQGDLGHRHEISTRGNITASTLAYDRRSIFVH